MFNRLKNIKLSKLVFILSLLFIASCSTSFAYNNLGWLSSFWVDDYVDLNKSQSKQLKAIINDTRDWHREVELPKYKADLLDLRQLLNNEADTAQLMKKITQVKQHWRNLLLHTSDPLIELAMTLTPSQRNEMVENIREKINEEIQEHTSLTKDEHLQQRLEKQLDYYKQWLGKLTSEQQTLISQANSAHTSTSNLWYDYKLTRLAALEALFTQQTLSEAEFSQQLRTIITEREQYMSNELLELNEQNLKAYAQLLLKLNKTLSTKQLAHVDEEFADLVGTVNELLTE
ncbi:DUF6279 family lipoprotein [Pseudoalteromonas sp. DL-6]|uniref:DUF6279 family lipoprotein n=1 Tax=Pseudoalteromonas sp. DL-6 TaxID=1390185 RepID=UPI00103E68E3|nr:DUF6279 family lipoprotein [Pseudoalteromonas sp. DL-6]QBJ64640.1 hypothetical protein B1F84_16440 [Pseudoalteromonas sp. DL-6]